MLTFMFTHIEVTILVIKLNWTQHKKFLINRGPYFAWVWETPSLGISFHSSPCPFPTSPPGATTRHQKPGPRKQGTSQIMHILSVWRSQALRLSTLKFIAVPFVTQVIKARDQIKAQGVSEVWKQCTWNANGDYPKLKLLLRRPPLAQLTCFLPLL